MQPISSVRRARLERRLVAACVAMLAAGCGTPLLDDDPLLAPGSDDRFEVIERFAPESESRAAPARPEDVPEVAAEDVLAALPARESVEVSLDEVRTSALANNLDLQVELIAPDIARAATDEERARFEAAFFARLEGEREENGGPLELSTDVTSERLEPGIRVPLRTGGTARVSLPTELTDVDLHGGGDQTAAESAARFSLSQPLLRDAGVEVNTAAIQVARFRTRQDEARAKLTAIRVLANAEKAYWALYAATREVEIQHDRYGWALEQVSQARRLVEGGVVPEIEVLRAETGVARRLESVIVAETARRFAETELKRITNRPDLPLESETVIRPVTEPRPLRYDLDPERLAARAVANRMEMLELEVQLSIDAVDVEVARNGLLPIFALDFDYSFRGAGERYTDARLGMADNDLSSWLVGATIEVPLGNAAARARLEQAVLARARTLASRSLRALAIRQETHDALDQLEGDWQRVLSARRETILAGRNFDAERRQFQAGVRTSTEVLEASDFLAEARSREARALSDHQRSLVDLAFATGTVLGQGRIRWPDHAQSPR